MFLEILIKIDVTLFFFLNHTCQNPVFDVIMPFITVKEHLAPAMLAFLVFLLWKGGPKGRIVVFLLIPALALSDQISAQLLKPLVSRLRPCYIFAPLENIHSVFGSKSSPSFPSAHASNSFAFATILMCYYPRYTALAVIVASAVAFSRIYVGVHYPFDVIAGALTGALCGVWVKYSYDFICEWKLWKKIKQKSIKRSALFIKR